MELKELLRKGESENLEFKSSLSLTKEIIETISAFANKNGGKIIVGVSNNGKVLGVKIGKDTIEKLTNKIISNTEPKIYPKISTKRIGKKNIIIIEVEKTDEKPVFAFGKAFKRVGKSTLRMSKSEIESIILKGKKLYWDEQICEEATLNDIDKKKVKWYLERREEIRRVKKPRKMDFKTLLLNIRAAKEIGKEIKPTYAGILFFGKNPQRFVPQSTLRLVKFAGKEITRNFIDRIDLSGTLWEMVENAEEFLRKNIRLLGFRTELSFRRIDKFEYPLGAIREGIINALIHRNYKMPSDTRVLLFDDRIEIISPGQFPEGVTPDNPKHLPINPILCQLMYDIGFVEKYGTGIYLMKELCKEHGTPEPIYELSDVEVKLIFKSGGKSILISEIENLVGLNERQKNALKFILLNGKITTKEYCNINGVVPDTANRDLNDLIRKGLIKRVGKGRSTHYISVIG